MDMIEKIKKRVEMGERKKIVFPESMDERVLEAAKILKEEDIIDVLLIGEEDLKDIGCEIINPKEYPDRDQLVSTFYDLRKHKGITMEDAKKMVLEDYPTFAAMLLKTGVVDGMVSGAAHSSADTLRVALQIIKTVPEIKTASTFFLMETKEKEFGLNGVFLYSDCGMIQNPTSEELVDIAKSSIVSFRMLTEEEPVVAFLSHSTYGSSKCPDTEKVVKAVELAKSEIKDVLVDGEMQFDAAIIKEIGEKKAPGSPVAGRANVLIFPDLDAGNIAYKITERLGHAKAYGPLTQGLLKPVNDLSRGCSALDIVGVAYITALQSERRE